MTNSIKAIGLNPAEHVHYLDHLSIICLIMDIPLLCLDAADAVLVQKYYPGVRTETQTYQEFTPEFLIANYDVLFLSDIWSRELFQHSYKELEKKYHKTLRRVYCPHGFSDKGFYLKFCVDEDVTLIYGQNMLDLLEHHKVLHSLPTHVISGNYRYTHFKNNRAFYNTLMEETIISHFDQRRPIILYAPTWGDPEDSGTFCEAALSIINNLPDHFNMIVKPHPLIEYNDIGYFYQLMGVCEKKPNVLFLNNFPLIYPLLAYTDVYLGDMSSVGYDYLIFNKPMFFINKNKRDVTQDRGVYLYRCGIDICPEEYDEMYQIIESNIQNDATQFSQIRKETYDYTFGKEKPFSQIKEEIDAALETPRRYTLE
jgi:hypothetical protein